MKRMYHSLSIMSNAEEMDSCVLNTQEINEDSKKRSFNESQNASWNESQDFRLIVEGDESMTDKVKLMEDEDKTNLQKSADSQQITDTSQTDDKVMAAKPNEEIKNIGDAKIIIEDEKVGNVTSNINDSERKDELSDEDEIIQATPPQNHSPSRKGVDITTSLKRKVESLDEPPAKIARTISMEDTANTEKQLEEEESRQSGGSDDSYQDLFKNIDRHVVIEETQDPSNQEFIQNSLASPHERATIDDDKTEKPHRSEQAVDQPKEEVFSEKCCSVEKDENLNVSAKLTDVSANDSIIVNVNSINESDSQVEDNDLSIDTKRDADSTLAAIDEKSAKEALDETNKSGKIENMEVEIEQTNSTEKTVDKDEDKEISSSQTKLRTSVELIYEGASQTGARDDKEKSKLKVVQIDEDEKIVDSSAEVIYDGKSSKHEPEVVEIADESREENERTRPGLFQDSEEGSEVQTMGKNSFENKSDSDFSYKESMKESSLDSKPPTMQDSRMVNGNLESKKNDNPDQTLSVESDTFSCDTIFTKADSNIDSLKKLDNIKNSSFLFRDPDNIEVISLSDNDTSNVEEKSKSELIHNSAPVKTVQMEREINLFVKLKCTIQMDESTKEYVNKELTVVHCEPVTIDGTMGRQKNEDSQSSLADISDNKDSSPGSINSNLQLYQLNPTRLSIMSSISSSSSASSAAALAAKLALKSQGFTMSLVPTRRDAKKLSSQDSQLTNETYDRVTREWKNHHLLTTTVLNCANTELSMTNVSNNLPNVDLMDHRNNLQHLRDNFVRSSTPAEETANAKIELTATPKNTKKGKAAKRSRSKMAKSNQTNQANGNNVASANTEQTLEASSSVAEAGDTPSNRKKSRLETTESKDALANSPSPQNDPADELIGKSVFAKWSDNNYYPGMVSDRLKAKYKVNFYDGKSKILIPDFVIPIPKVLNKGLSVYATINDYGYCGIIIDSHVPSSTMSNGDQHDSDTCYTVETDADERLRVQVRDIFLSADQAQVLKEEWDHSMSKISLPSIATPKVLGQVTLDNMVDGKRRSKRIGTPVFSTPKSRTSGTSGSTSKKSFSEPSVSGVSVKSKNKTISENEGLSSGESNVEPAEDELALRGLQRDIVGTYQQKGPQSRIKGRSRNKKKVEDPEIIAQFGPIPPANSNIFKGMSFILTCLASKDLDRHQNTASAISGVETEVTDTETETDNEEGWNVSFDRARLQEQILAGGGKIYEEFEQIPKDEYSNTKLITNVPNRTAKSILCLSANIPACNHKWIIRCCSEGKIVNSAENALPTGWSFYRKSYVEEFQARSNKPLSEMIVIIPNLIYDRLFATFWQKVCDNAGAVVLTVENLGIMETMDFDSNVVVVSNRKCPSWAVDRANHLKIPILSTMWVIQCLIEGKLCPYDQHPRYKYNYIPN